jgi:hypothetical protein
VRNPRPCVCGHPKGAHLFVRCLRDRCSCSIYLAVSRTEPLRARPRPTFTTTWPREPSSPRLKVLVRNEARDVVAVCYGTTEGVTLPSNLAPGQRYTLQPIFYVHPANESVPIRVAE